jgi:hypothetical protein
VGGEALWSYFEPKFPHSEWCVTWRIVVVKEPLVCNFTADAPDSVSQTLEYL